PPYTIFVNERAASRTYTLSLHDALPILHRCDRPAPHQRPVEGSGLARPTARGARGPQGRLAASGARRRSTMYTGVPWTSRSSTTDRKSTRLNSSHVSTSYSVFCLTKTST